MVDVREASEVFRRIASIASPPIQTAQRNVAQVEYY
jgi:hypothetical protein